MSRFLRTASTTRLLSGLAVALAVIVGGAAIAVAAATSGPVPPPRTLPQAIHQALKGPAVDGITARVTFTNHLLAAADLQGADPLLNGATGRLWLSPSQHRLRLELQSTGGGGDLELVVNNRAVWAYDPSSGTVYKGKLPAREVRGAKGQRPAGDRVPAVSQIAGVLRRLGAHLNISGASPGDIAGQPAYTVSISPKLSGGLLGSLALAWDAVRGVPLRFAVFAKGQSTPVLELVASDISYGAVPASDFAVSPRAGAKVVNIAAPARAGEASAGAGGSSAGGRRPHPALSGAQAVARQLPFTLAAPLQLAGRTRHRTTLLHLGGHPAALVTYGENLDGLAVLEQAQATGAKPPAAPSSGSGEGRQGLALPTVGVGSVTGQELQTPLGTVVRFERGGVSYTVLGSVAPSVVIAAARAL